MQEATDIKPQDTFGTWTLQVLDRACGSSGFPFRV